MEKELVDTVPYLRAVRARFGSERNSYDEFFRIYLDFKERIDGHEIMRRSKELFDGDEEMVTGFYRLLLEQKRKKKRSDDFGNALTRICPLMNNEAHKSFSEILYLLQKNDFTLDAFQQMGKNKRSHCNDIDGNVDCTDSENKKQRCIKSDSREDNKGNDNAKISYNDGGKSNKMAGAVWQEVIPPVFPCFRKVLLVMSYLGIGNGVNMAASMMKTSSALVSFRILIYETSWLNCLLYGDPSFVQTCICKDFGPMLRHSPLTGMKLTAELRPYVFDVNCCGKLVRVHDMMIPLITCRVLEFLKSLKHIWGSTYIFQLACKCCDRY